MVVKLGQKKKSGRGIPKELIFDRRKLGKLTGGYVSVPPEVVIEVDTKADLRKEGC